MTRNLVLLPGLLCDGRLWRDPLAALGDAVSPVIADLTQDDSIPEMAARTLAKAPTSFALAGLSMGGYVALEIMRQAPERVTHLAMLDTMARPDDAARRAKRRADIESIKLGKFIGVSRALLASLLAPQHLNTPLAEDVQAMSERVGQQAYISQQTAILGRTDSRPSLGAITVPTLVGVGEADILTPLAMAEEMVAGISGAELVVFPDSAHLPTMENPDAVVVALRRWLAK